MIDSLLGVDSNVPIPLLRPEVSNCLWQRNAASSKYKSVNWTTGSSVHSDRMHCILKTMKRKLIAGRLQLILHYSNLHLNAIRSMWNILLHYFTRSLASSDTPTYYYIEIHFKNSGYSWIIKRFVHGKYTQLSCYFLIKWLGTQAQTAWSINDIDIHTPTTASGTGGPGRPSSLLLTWRIYIFCILS
jgi:hypothetical protein